MGQRGKSAVKSLVCEFHQSYFLTNKTLEINRKLVSERSANFYLVFSRENSTVAITIFCIVCFEAVVRGLDDVSNNRTKCADVPGIRPPFNYNL